MKSPIERTQETDKQKLPLRGEGNVFLFPKIKQSENTFKNLNLDSVGEIKRHD